MKKQITVEAEISAEQSDILLKLTQEFADVHTRQKQMVQAIGSLLMDRMIPMSDFYAQIDKIGAMETEHRVNFLDAADAWARQTGGEK